MFAVSADMIPPQQLALQRDGDGNDQITLRKGEFRKYTYSAVLPPNMRGNVRIEPVGLDAAPMMLVVVRNTGWGGNWYRGTAPTGFADPTGKIGCTRNTDCRSGRASADQCANRAGRP